MSHDDRDMLDTTLNYSAHSEFVAKWLDKLEAEGKPHAAAVPEEENVNTAPEVELRQVPAL
jgi:peroxiredoxin Q/BCP